MFFSLFPVKIGIFYAIFYSVLAGLVAICMWVFFQTLDPRIPKWRLRESIIGTNPGNEIASIKVKHTTRTAYLLIENFHPVSSLLNVLGLGFRPMPPHEDIESSLIYYRGTRHEDYSKWTDALDEFLAGN